MKIPGEADRWIGPRAIDLSVGLPPAGAITQAKDDAVVCAGAFTLAAGLQSGVEGRIQGCSRTRRQHSNHGIRFTLQLDGLPDQIGVGMKGGAPQAIGEDHGLRAVRAILVLSESSADGWANTEDIEIMSGDAARVYVLATPPGPKSPPG